MQGVRKDLNDLIDRASNIEDTAISPEYDEAFIAMEDQITDVRQKLEAVNITKDDLENLKKQMDELSAKIDNAKETFSAKNQRITSLATDVNLAEASLNTFNESIKTITHSAEELQAKADEIRRSDIKGASEIVEESARKSAEAERVITQQLEKIGQAETERSRAEQLLDKHRRDFDIQYEENQKKLEEVSSLITSIEKTLPSLNREVCGAETIPCDSICGGPSSKCSHCGGSSCPGSVSKAAQAQEFAQEAADRVRAKQREAEDILKKIRETIPIVEAAKRSTNEAFRAAQDEVDKVNKTRDSLVRQIDEIRTFLSSSRNTQADIASLVDEILNITIPFNENQIRELTENIRVKVLEIPDAAKILQETRGNKTTALELQQAADRASERAARIHNTTKAIKDALEQTEKAQEATNAILNQITQKMDKAKGSLSVTDQEVMELEKQSSETAARIRDLHNITNTLKAEYIKITSNSKAATASANNAASLVNSINAKHNSLKETFDKVHGILEKRESGSEERKNRAEALRRRTTDLLARIKHSREEKNLLIQRADSLDVELNGFRRTIDQMSEQIEQVYAEIDRRVEYHSSCDA